jgi:hypothetical protein
MMELCKTYRNAESQFKERLLVVRDIWQRTSLQLNFLRSISAELGGEFKAVQNEKLLVLVNRLTILITRLESSKVGDAEGTFRKIKFTVRKDGLDDVIRELSDWQTRFDPSRLLLLRLSSPQVHNQLQKKALGPQRSGSASLFRKLAKDQPLEDNERPRVSLRPIELEDTVIKLSTTRYGRKTGSEEYFIADNVP